MEASAIVGELQRYTLEPIAIRHDIHEHSEAGFEEVRTSKFVVDRLKS